MVLMNIEIQTDRLAAVKFRATLMERKICIFGALGICRHGGGLRTELLNIMKGLEADIHVAEQFIMELRWQTD